jgi:hypothetical protein
LPTSVEAVKHQAVVLKNYSDETWQGYLHILVVFSLIYVWKQAFSVPGAIFLVSIILYIKEKKNY